MKFFLLAILFFLFFACESSNDEQKFLDLYRKILAIRVTENDSLEANKKVLELLKANGYTEPEFRKKFFELAANQKNFIRLIDSLRNSVKNDYQKIIDSTKKVEKNVVE